MKHQSQCYDYINSMLLLNVGRGGGGGPAIKHTTSGVRHQDCRTAFSGFFNYTVLQYAILLKSKLFLFCVTLVNHIGSHALIGYFFFNCGILTLLCCALSTLFSSSLLSLLSPLLSPFSPLYLLRKF